MAGRVRASRPLPAEPVEEDTYPDPGFDEQEFSVGEEGGNYANTPAEPTEDDTYQDPGFEQDEFTDDEDVYENTADKDNSGDESPDDKDTMTVTDTANSPMVYEEVPPPPPPQRQAPQRQAHQRRPPTPSDSTDEEYEVPSGEPSQETYEDIPQPETQETYEDINEGVTRPPLPVPMQQQDDCLAPGQVGSGPAVTGHPHSKKKNRPGQPPPELQRQPSGANRSLPPLPPGGSNTPKKSLSSRPLPNVPGSDSKSLSNYPWYFGDIDRNKATNKIKNLHQDGAYLIRSSKTDPKSPYTLAIFYKSKVWNLHIHIRSDKKFAIGAVKQDEQSFADIVELVEYHKTHNIILMGQNGGETRLVKHPKK